MHLFVLVPMLCLPHNLPSRSAFSESMSLLLPVGVFHHCNLDLASYMHNLASPTSFRVVSRVESQIHCQKPHRRCLSLKASRIVGNSQRSECQSHCETDPSMAKPIGVFANHMQLLRALSYVWNSTSPWPSWSCHPQDASVLPTVLPLLGYLSTPLPIDLSSPSGGR